jgi:hypothetical protein
MSAGEPTVTSIHKHGYLTKTRFVNGLACPKWLWLAFNAPDRLPEADRSGQHRLDEGRRIGELARQRFPKGILLEMETIEENVNHSTELVKKRVPLFEAGFIHSDKVSYARADVLVPVGKDQWDLVEVKGTTEVKEEHIADVAFQHRVYSDAGLKIRRCLVLHLNKSYVRSGEVDLPTLFQEVDVTREVATLAPDIPPLIEDLLKVTWSSSAPEFGRGESFHKDMDGVHVDDALWKEHPASDLMELYYGGKKALDWLETGTYWRIRDVPRDQFKGNGARQQAIQQEAYTSGQPHIDQAKLSTFLKNLQYPLHFLDFETFQPAIPLFDDSWPYQQVPFQFSLHVVEKPGAKARHHGYLSMEAKDPRQGFAEALRSVLGASGHVVAWNVSFERGRLKELAAYLPEHAGWLSEVDARFVDLLVPFRNFDYYHPVQKGSASIKAVLPAMMGKGYEDLAISDGGSASLAYLETVWGHIYGMEVSKEQFEATKRNLEAYCGRDTEAMVWIVEKLVELAG